jgi:hypothetical protein
MKKYLSRLLALLLCQSRTELLRAHDPSRDPLLRLQYLARLSWQYDIADLTALICTPCIVSLVVWRDGLYTVDGTGILVRACDLRYVWLRFGVLLIIKPVASTVARMILKRAMRKTLLGKATLHGTSQLAARIMAEQRLGVIDGVSKVRSADDRVQSAFDFVEEELEAVRAELSLSGLNFGLLRVKQMRKWRFFLAVVLLQLFSAFRVRVYEPLCYYKDADTTIVEYIDAVPLPLASAWDYVPPSVLALADRELGEALLELETDPSVCWSRYTGWTHPPDLVFNLTSSSEVAMSVAVQALVQRPCRSVQ